MPSEYIPVSESQRIELCSMLATAFVEIRRLGWHEGNAEQAGSLADAFHNLPSEMWKADFNLVVFRDLYLSPYQAKYPDGCRCDFISWVDEIISMLER